MLHSGQGVIYLSVVFLVLLQDLDAQLTQPDDILQGLLRGGVGIPCNITAAYDIIALKNRRAPFASITTSASLGTVERPQHKG